MEGEHTRQDEAVGHLNMALRRFRRAMNNGMVVMKELGSALGEVSSAFEDIALTTTEAGELQAFAQTHREEAPATAAPSPPTAGGSLSSTTASLFPRAASTESASGVSLMEASLQLRQFVQTFSAEVRYLREGAPFMCYNEGIHSSVVGWLKVVDDELHLTGAATKRRKRAFPSYQQRKREVEHEEAKYIKKNKPIATSKRYLKQVESRNSALSAYRAEKASFNSQFVTLMRRNAHATMCSVRQYLALTAGYMRDVVAALERTDPDLGDTPPAAPVPGLPVAHAVRPSHAGSDSGISAPTGLLQSLSGLPGGLSSSTPPRQPYHSLRLAELTPPTPTGSGAMQWSPMASHPDLAATTRSLPSGSNAALPQHHDPNRSYGGSAPQPMYPGATPGPGGPHAQSYYHTPDGTFASGYVLEQRVN